MISRSRSKSAPGGWVMCVPEVTGLYSTGPLMVGSLGVNLAGVEIITRMRRRMVDMQKQIEDLLAYLRESGVAMNDLEGRAPREALVKAAAGQLQPVDLF